MGAAQQQKEKMRRKTLNGGIGDSINMISPSNRVPFVPVECYPCNSVYFAIYILEEYDPARCAAILKNTRKHLITPQCTKEDRTAVGDFYHHFFIDYTPSESALQLYKSHKEIHEFHVDHYKDKPNHTRMWIDIRKRWHDELVDKLRRKRKIEDVDSSDTETLGVDDCVHFKLMTTPVNIPRSIISPSK